MHDCVTCMPEGKRTSLWTSINYTSSYKNHHPKHTVLLTATTVCQGKHVTLRHFYRCYLKENEVKVKEHGKLIGTSFLKVCWCCLPNIIKICPCLSKLRLAKFGIFLRNSLILCAKCSLHILLGSCAVSYIYFKHW